MNAATAAVRAGMQLVVFRLEARLHAVPLAAVERVVAAADVTPLPGAPRAVLGAIDLAGRILPVFCLRRRFFLPDRPLSPADQFLVVRTLRRTLALVVDDVREVATCAAPWTDTHALAPGLEPFQGVARLPDGLLLIHDLERLLSADEEQALAGALEGRA